MAPSCSPGQEALQSFPVCCSAPKGVTLQCECKYVQGIIKKRKFKCKQNSKTSTNSTVSYQEMTVFIKSIKRGERWRGHRWVQCVIGHEFPWGEGWGWDGSPESDPSSLPIPVRSSAYGALLEVCIPACFKETLFFLFAKRSLTF